MLRRSLIVLSYLARKDAPSSTSKSVRLHTVTMPTTKRSRHDSTGNGIVDDPPSLSTDGYPANKRPRRTTVDTTTAQRRSGNRVDGDAAGEYYDLAEFPARSTSLWKFGPHVSAAGGVENAVLNAAKIGCVGLLTLRRRGCTAVDVPHRRSAQCHRVCALCKVPEEVGEQRLIRRVCCAIQGADEITGVRQETRLAAWKLPSELGKPRQVRAKT